MDAAPASPTASLLSLLWTPHLPRDDSPSRRRRPTRVDPGDCWIILWRCRPKKAPTVCTSNTAWHVGQSRSCD